MLAATAADFATASFSNFFASFSTAFTSNCDVVGPVGSSSVLRWNPTIFPSLNSIISLISDRVPFSLLRWTRTTAFKLPSTSGVKRPPGMPTVNFIFAPPVNSNVFPPLPSDNPSTLPVDKLSSYSLIFLELLA